MIKSLLKSLLGKCALQAFHQAKKTYGNEKRMHNYAVSNKNKINKLLDLDKEIKLEIGAGSKKGTKEWLTLDISDGADIVHDLLTPLPFPDNSVSFIYASHVLEHFYYSEILMILKECHRILKQNGEISICVPDASIYIKAYQDPSHFEYNKFILVKEAYYDHSPIDLINYIAYMGNNHKYLFETTNLLNILGKSGFADVRTRDFNPGLDLELRKIESIYAIGKK